MLIFLSPAKTLAPDAPPLQYADVGEDNGLTMPALIDEAAVLAAAIRSLDLSRVRSVFSLSETRARDVINDYREWRGDRRRALPALQLYRGEAFKALDARSLSPDDLIWSQTRLRIFSGLYGILRPLDLIEPYRLDFDTAISGTWGSTVYAYWQRHIGDHLIGEIKRLPPDQRVLLNLASSEYGRALRPVAQFQTIAVSFKEETARGVRTIGVFAKQARGRLARWLIANRVTDPDALYEYAENDYRVCASLSTERDLVFTRRSNSS